MIKKIIADYFKESEEIPAILQPSYLPSLDGLRGISIIIVLIAHFNAHYYNKVFVELVGAGIVGVYIFFVISGFLITTLLLKERILKRSINLKRFYARRFLRTFPLAYLYIFIILFLSFFLKEKIKADSYLIAGLYLVNFAHFFRLPYYFIHYWSLSAEEQFYIISPTVLKFNLGFYKIFIFIMLGLSFLARFYINRSPAGISSRLLFDLTRNLDGLLIGSLFSLLLFAGLVPLKFIKKYKVSITAIAFIGILVLNREAPVYYLRFFFNHTFYSILIGIIIIANISPSSDVFYRILNHPFLKKIGVISYSIYIWQQLFTSYVFTHSLIINLILIIVISLFSYYFYERYFLNLKNRFK